MMATGPNWTSLQCAPLSRTTGIDQLCHDVGKAAACAKCFILVAPQRVGQLGSLGISDTSAITFRRVAWCPAPGCAFAVQCNTDVGQHAVDIACKCGSTFCFACKEEAHRPVRDNVHRSQKAILWKQNIVPATGVYVFATLVCALLL